MPEGQRGRPPGTTRLHGDDGTALISAWFTLPIILVFLLFATQLAFAMYTTTMVEGIAFDAAYDVASARTLRAIARLRRSPPSRTRMPVPPG